MNFRWADLDDRERRAFPTVFAFLRSRLNERHSIEWALRLKSSDRLKRAAVQEVLDRGSQSIAEPWRSAWRLIEESWAADIEEADRSDAHRAKRRLQQGERSGALIKVITNLVAPRLALQALGTAVKRPRTIHDLLSVRLTSGMYVDPQGLPIDSLDDEEFLAALARSLESAIATALDSARRTGWDGRGLPWQIGRLVRVYYASGGRGDDPDKYGRGIAPSVKLLFAVVNRLASVQPEVAREFAQRWSTGNSAVHLRLWAAIARDAAIVEAEGVSRVLRSLDDEQFWNLHYFPELTELRATRFADLTADIQTAIVARIRRLPPLRLWRRNTGSSDELERARVGRAIVELRRIQTAGATLSERDRDWLAAHAEVESEIPEAVSLDYGFTRGISARAASLTADRSYDALSGEDRLKALERAIAEPRRHWDEDPAACAFAWLRETGNAFLVVGDLEPLVDAGADFPKLWGTLPIVHLRHHGSTEPQVRDYADEAARMLALLARLPDPVARAAIDSITHWLLHWREHFPPAQAPLWLRLWRMAVEAANAGDGQATRPASPGEEDAASVEIDPLDSSVGRLVAAFVASCPSVPPGARPFDADHNLYEMREAILGSTGHAKFIALHRLIEDLRYFLNVDPAWAAAHLVAPLHADDAQARALWHAIALETRFREVLKSIGEAMAQRASDPRLSRETRQSLAFSLVIDYLHALNDGRSPAVPRHRAQQMLRSVDDETRVHAADAVQRFLAEVPGEQLTPEELFQTAVLPFLHEVWPQERSLVTRGISAAFARIPASVMGVFANAVNSIERFLVPFECWGMYEYGLEMDEGERSDLAKIDNTEKSTALTRLLDLTIGSTEGAVIPQDLSLALERIREVAPKLVDNRVYRRLAACARRG